MSDKIDLRHLSRNSDRTSPPPTLFAKKKHGEDSEKKHCLAFGFLRGLRERALAIEFRFKNGNSDGYSYSLLASWRHNPSVGLLLKFTGGDVITLVLIRGSTLGIAAVISSRTCFSISSPALCSTQ